MTKLAEAETFFQGSCRFIFVLSNMKNKTKNIIETATTLFMQNGIQPVSMDTIASYSGISKKTLYENFQSKELLVETIVQRLILKTGKYIRLCPDISPNAVKEMENFVEHLFGVLENVTPKFVMDLKKYYPETYTQLIVFRDNSILPYLERCFKRGITEDHFRPHIKMDTAWLYCWQIQNALEGDTSHADVNKIIGNANDLFLHGILNPKGLKLLRMNLRYENSGRNDKLRTG